MKQRSGSIFFYITTVIVIISAVFFVCYKSHRSLPATNGIAEPTADELNSYSTWYIGDAFVPKNISPYTAYSCYTLSVRLPEGMHDISFRIPPVYSYIQFRCNNTILYTHEISSPDCIIPSPQIVHYHTDTNYITIELYLVDNSSNIKLPFTNPLTVPDFLIGTPAAINHYQITWEMIDLTILVFYVVALLFHLIFFFYKKYDTTHIAFVLLLISVLINVNIYCQNLLHYYAAGITFSFATRLLTLSYAARLLSISMLIKKLFSGKLNASFCRIYNSVSIMVSVCIFFLPAELFAYSLHIFYTQTIISLAYALYASVNTYVKSKSIKYNYCAFSFEMLLLGAVFEFLFSFNLTMLYYIFPILTIIFVLMYAFLISFEYNNSLRNIKKLTPLLKEKVYELQNNKSTYISSHIKPDYLYETLDTIQNSIDKDQAKVDTLIQSLATYLRQTLDFSEDMQQHSLNDEIKACQSFITLTKEFHPEIIFEINIEENIPNVTVPKYSLQSIIENAIKHAFTGKLHPIVYINVSKAADRVKLSVKDNGIGMTRDEINFALHMPNAATSMGLYQIDHLLRDFFDSSLHVESSVNKYTLVEFSIHIQEVTKNA